MKIIHVNTTSSGGAYIACERISNGLKTYSLESEILSIQKKEGNLDIQEVAHNEVSRLSRIARRIDQKYYSYDEEIASNAKKMEIFTFPFTIFSVENHPSVLDADIIHLHWISSFVNYKSFFNIQKPIVWTIHDLNPFMGGLHYTIDESRISKKLLKYEMKLRYLKHKYIRDKGIHFVFLSRWLYEEACRLAPWLKKERVNFIYNGINSSIFSYQDMSEARKRLGLPLNKRILLFISEDVQNYRKGFDFLQKTLTSEFLGSNQIYPIALGNSSNTDNSKIHFAGPIVDPNIIADYYSASDLCFLPSRQDNLPNVMLEALLSGCPVISSQAGGMNECIDDSNGILFKDFTFSEVQRKILQLLNKKVDRRKIAEDALEKFDIKKITKNYIDLYKSISI